MRAVTITSLESGVTQLKPESGSMKPDNAIVPSSTPEPCASPVDDASIETPPARESVLASAGQQVWAADAAGAARKAESGFPPNTLPIIESVPTTGVTDLRGIALALNSRGVRIPRGGRRHAPNVGTSRSDQRHRSCLIGGNCDPACIRRKGRIE